MGAGVLVRYTAVCGPADFGCVVLLPLVDGKSAEEIVGDYFAGFFGCDTRQDGHWYFGCGGEVAVKVDGYDIVPDEDYAVLQRYL